jgi:DNA gyrase/topoisomerase IV subunit B
MTVFYTGEYGKATKKTNTPSLTIGSVAGSITSCRDVNTQAVFRLKGKALNVWDLKRDAAPAKRGKSCETTRFKLGEISPKEFAQFIGKEMKLSQVEYAHKHEASGILSFYMGKNTPERKDYIMGNLVVPVEE